MKLYAERPAVLVRQLFTDVLVAVWVYAWVTVAVRLHDLIEKLAVPGERLESAGHGLSDNLSGAANRVGDIPGAGNSLAAPFRRAAEAADGLAGAGQQQQEVVGDLAVTLTVLVVAVPLALVVLIWLPLRVRWVRRASAGAALRAEPAGRDLLALRALVSQPLGRLTALDPEIAAAWRRGDEDAVDRLAALELRGLGLGSGR